LFKNNYLINQNFLTTHLSLNFSILHFFPCLNNFCNKSFHGIVHCILNKFSKLVHLAHLSSFAFIFIPYIIF
jgi:hypothetical protein